MSMNTTTTVREENGAWMVTEVADTPMGAATDTATVEKGSLILKKRVAKQGPMSVEMQFEGNKMTGTLTMNGPPKPIAVDLGGPLSRTPPAPP